MMKKRYVVPSIEVYSVLAMPYCAVTTSMDLTGEPDEEEIF